MSRWSPIVCGDHPHWLITNACLLRGGPTGQVTLGYTSPWGPSLELLAWCLIYRSNLWNLIEDRASVDCKEYMAMCQGIIPDNTGDNLHFSKQKSLSGDAWWRHQMETFSALLAICGGIHRSPVKSPHKGQWRGALIFSLICAWIIGWANNGEAGCLRCHRTHYDITVMVAKCG